MRDDQVKRYARHVLLSDVGGVGQRRIFAARARVADAGGAGAVAIVYLAAAGVGVIVIPDDAKVGGEDVGFLYELADVGRPRREAARDRVRSLNPDVRVEDDGPGTALSPGAGDPLLLGARAARDFLLGVIA